jgi:hypothetical protein
MIHYLGQADDGVAISMVIIILLTSGAWKHSFKDRGNPIYTGCIYSHAQVILDFSL